MAEPLLRTARKNAQLSFGLTLVVGLPLPKKLFDPLQLVQNQLEETLPNHFTWYQSAQSHITLYAPLRSQKRDFPPLQQHELPSDPDAFAAALSKGIAALSPFTLVLGKPKLSELGHVVFPVAGAARVKQHLIETFASLDGSNAPKSASDQVHGTFGYLHRLPTAPNLRRLHEVLSPHSQAAIGDLLVERVWLVHYAHRTLSNIVGKTCFELGRAKPIATHGLLQSLKLA